MLCQQSRKFLQRKQSKWCFLLLSMFITSYPWRLCAYTCMLKEALSFFCPSLLGSTFLAIICLLICRTVANTKQSSKTFKQQRQEEKKASEASGNTRSWNTLFMRPDTVCTQSDIINWIPSFPWMLVIFCLLETIRLTCGFIMHTRLHTSRDAHWFFWIVVNS